ncbi:MAG: hypothetical protein R3F34_15430 [Planctomycetota bacterium]
MTERARPRGSVRAADAAIAIVLGAAALFLYRATLQGYLYDDGPKMASFVSMELGLWYHVLLVPVGVWVKHAMGVEEGVAPLMWVSSVSGALTVGATFAFLRLVGVARRTALVVAASLMLSPALWFHSTTVEVHGLHAGVMALGALWIAVLPWSRGSVGFALSVVLASLPVGLAVLAHRSGLAAGAGWLALAHLVAVRRGVRRPWWTWIALVGPLFLAVGLFANEYGAWIVGGEAVPGAGAGSSAIGVWRVFLLGGNPLVEFVLDWVVAWPVLALGAMLLALRRDSLRRSGYVVLAAGALPLAIFSASVGLLSLGGYGLAATPFVALAAAYGLEPVLESLGARRLALALAAVALVHVSIARAQMLDGRRVELARIGAERVREARELLPDGGFFLSADSTGQLVSGWIPRVQELAIGRLLPAERNADNPFPDRLPVLDALVAANGGRVAWDPNWRETLDPASTIDEVNLLPLEAYLEANHAVERRRVGAREYWLLSPKGSE